MRFLAVEFASEHDWRVLHQVRVPVRLGHDVFITGAISVPTISRTVAAFEAFAEQLRALGIGRYRAVATSALRESSNGADVIAEVLDRTGIAIELIDGAEEARLAFYAIRARVRLAEDPWLLADLGGGSLELSLVNAASISETVSLPLGAVRILEAVGADASLADFRQKIAENEEQLIASEPLRAHTVGMIATGGSADAIARLLAAPIDERGVATMPRSALRQAATEVAATPVAERMRKFELQPDRADVILPAMLLYERVAELAGADHIVVPGVGVKEGVLIDLLTAIQSAD
jgi:exopolyphosphatase/guanosine-5'-triphosphate,3'-diphosphate pyrophosphatase